MSRLPDGVRRVFRLARRGRAVARDVDGDVDAEVAFHLDMRVAELVAGGLSADAARAEAVRRFGDPQQWSRAMSTVDRERVAGERRAEWLDDLRQDLRFGVRALVRAPVFTILAVSTLALGIGANAAVFGVVKSVLLDALPYADAGRLVRVHGRLLDGSVERMPLSAGTVVDLRERQRSFAALAAFEARTRDAVYTGDDGPRVLKAAYVEPALFPTLGVSVALGRPLREDDAASDTLYHVVITHATWQRTFAGDPSVIGRTMRVNGVPRTVVGVLARDFVGPVEDAELYFPMDLARSMRDPVFAQYLARRRQYLGLVGRLHPGVTIEAAARDVASVSADLAREYPQYNGSFGSSVAAVRDDMVGDTRAPLLVLMASAALVLLVTCANLAAALLSRTLSRRREFAVRVALGAGRGRVIRQLLTESALLAVFGGAAGIVLAAAALAMLRRFALPFLPEYAELALDQGALLVTTLVALATGLAFGLAPALSVGRVDPQGTLREEGRAVSESRRSRRLRGALVAGQITLCVSLLAGAGLLARSLAAMTAAPLGLDPGGVLTVPVQLPRDGYRDAAARVRFIAQFEDRLRAIPGVAGVATSGEVPTRVMNRNDFRIEGAAPTPDDARPSVYYQTVSDDYFRTLGVRVLHGRTFGPQDGGVSGAPALVISESMANRFWPRGDALGARIRLSTDTAAPSFTVIGIVADVRNGPVRAAPEPMLYDSIRENPYNGPNFIVRTSGDPIALLGVVRRELAAIDTGLPIHDAATLTTLVADGLAGRRLPVLLMGAFAALALLLASVGVYAMFAAMAAAREREFGVRVALGSTPAEIAALVLKQGGVWMAAGLAGGVIGVVVVARLVRNLLFGVAPFDVVALGIAAALLLACGAVALLVPVRRATRVDPIVALK